MLRKGHGGRISLGVTNSNVGLALLVKKLAIGQVLVQHENKIH